MWCVVVSVVLIIVLLCVFDMKLVLYVDGVKYMFLLSIRWKKWLKCVMLFFVIFVKLVGMCLVKYRLNIVLIELVVNGMLVVCVFVVRLLVSCFVCVVSVL